MAAVDEHGAELDILLQTRCDKATAKRFSKRAPCSSPVPHRIVTDQLLSNPETKGEIPELANVKHMFFKAAARRIATNQHASASSKCVAFASLNAHRYASPASGHATTFRALAASVTHFTLSKTSRGAIRHLA
jgi:transposase-like protein